MGGFPSGQREQTVNLSSMTSVVRIHHLPPKRNRYHFGICFFLLVVDSKAGSLTKRRWRFVTGVAFPQESESTTSQHLTHTAILPW